MQQQQQQQQQQQSMPYMKAKRSKKMRKTGTNYEGKSIILNRNMDSLQHRAYQSDVSVSSSHSNKSKKEEKNPNDSSIIGSFTSMAFGYIMGSGTTPQ